MPKYYCDYCDIFLTHDSPSVRKAHCSGWKHRNAVQQYYSTLPQDKIQHVINEITRAFEGVGGMLEFAPMPIPGQAYGVGPPMPSYPTGGFRPGGPGGPGGPPGPPRPFFAPQAPARPPGGPPGFPFPIPPGMPMPPPPPPGWRPGMPLPMPAGFGHGQ